MAKIEPKIWKKINITPATAKVIKRVALDTEKYGYQVVDDMFLKAYPEYFKEN
jgi:hypothetical protein